MATRTAPKKPAPRSVTITLGGRKPAGKRATAKRKARSAVLRNTRDSWEWSVARFVGRHTWRGVVAGTRWTGHHGLAVAGRVSGSARELAADKARYGFRTPLVRVTTPDGTERIPMWHLHDRTERLLGLAEEPQYRSSGDRIAETEPPKVWAAARRMDREPIDNDDTADEAGKEMVMHDASKWADPEALAAPAIDPENWKDELPAYLATVADGAKEAMAGFDALWAYLDGAGVDEAVMKPVEEARDHVSYVWNLMIDSSNKAVEVYQDVALPDFRKVS